MQLELSQTLPKAVPPKPNRFMTHLHTLFMKKVLNITERKRETNVHHYCKSDDFWASFKVVKSDCFVIQRCCKAALPTSS